MPYKQPPSIMPWIPPEAYSPKPPDPTLKGGAGGIGANLVMALGIPDTELASEVGVFSASPAEFGRDLATV